MASSLFKRGLVWSHTGQLSVSEQVFSFCLTCGVRMALSQDSCEVVSQSLWRMPTLCLSMAVTRAAIRVIV